MPLIDCSVDGEPGVKWGESGTCYTYAAGDDEGRKDAVKKAMAQAIAIGDIDTERAITVDELEARAPGDVDLTPTAGMAAAARKGLRLYDEGKGGAGLVPATIRDARKMVAREPLSEDKVRRIGPWWARHADDWTQADTKAGEETPGYVAALLWGINSTDGSPGATWAERKVAELDRAADDRARPNVITRALPDNYRLALEDDVPEGRACGNCVFYNEAKRDGETVWCERWDDWVRGDYYCNAWQSNEESETNEDGLRAAIDNAKNAYVAPALIVTIGAPGAGKSTWIANNLPDAQRVSLEQIRREPNADRGEIINAAVSETFEALRNDKLVVFDSTAILGQMRARLRGIARALNVPAHGVVFDEPLSTLLDAQRNREHPVPDERVRELYNDLQNEMPTIVTEDWRTLRIIRRTDAEEGGREATYQESSVETKPTDTLDNERSFSPVAVEFRESGAGTNYKTLIGYPAVFNRMSEDLGGFREVIAPGAFTRALERGDTIKLLYDHDTAAVLASTDNGTLELREDEIGLHMWARVDMADPDVQRVSAKLRSGIVDQMSFAFTMGQAGEEDWDYSGGVPLRTIRAVESLPEVSVVSMPAYLDSKVALLERARLNGRLPELVGAANVAPETVGDESPENTRGTDPKTSAYWRAQLLKRKQEQNRWTS